MRNWYDGGCDCNNPDPVIGVIVGGKKFPFGTVKQSDYNADQKEVNDRLAVLDNRINVNKQLTDTEINAIKQKLEADEKKIDRIELSTISAAKDVAEIKGRIASFDSTISEIKIALNNINATIKSITDVTDNLDARVTALEQGPSPEPVPPVQKFYVYWGASAAEIPNMAVVSSLAYKTYTDTISRTISVPVNEEYIYYAFPKDKGTVRFTVAGNEGGFEEPVDVPVTDSEGNTVIYRVYRSVQKLDITVPIVVSKG